MSKIKDGMQIVDEALGGAQQWVDSGLKAGEHATQALNRRNGPIRRLRHLGHALTHVADSAEGATKFAPHILRAARAGWRLWRGRR